ncbi:MAG: ABC transporter permease [Bacillota bacterium]
MLRNMVAFARQGFHHMFAYRVDALLSLVGNFAMMLLHLAIWSSVLQESPAARAEMLEYAFLNQLLMLWYFLPTWELGGRFRQGDVALELVKPVPMPLRYMGDFLGRDIHRVMLALPAYALAVPLVGVLRWPGWDVLLLFLLSALLGWLINATVRFCVSFTALWTVQFTHGDHLLQVLVYLLSGYFLPLWYLPESVAALARWLPFQGIFFIPTAIYTGALSGTAALVAILFQIGWALAGSLLLAWVWRTGTRKLSVMGG